MNTQEKVKAIGHDDVQQYFHSFLESVTHIDSILQEENTADEVKQMEQELDVLYDVAEDVYCALAGGERCIPDNYTDFYWAVANESERCGIPEDEIWQIVDSVEQEYTDISPQRAWKEVLSRLQREERMRRIIQGQTKPSDWK